MTNGENIKLKMSKALLGAIDKCEGESLHTFIIDLYNVSAIDDTFVNTLFNDFDEVVFKNLSEAEKDEYVESGRYLNDFVDWLGQES